MLRSLLLSLVAVLILTACAPIELLRGTGNLVTVDYDLAGFDKVNASAAFNVAITQGDDFKVSITADDNVMQRIDVEVRGNTLQIGLKPMITLGEGTLIAEITMPALAGIDFSGATTGRITGFGRTEEFTGRASGASSITGELEAGRADIDISGASTAAVTGSAETLRVSASGASKAMLGDLEAVDVEARASGASHVEVNVSGTLTGDANGASGIRYTGSPEQVRVNTSGASSVREQ